jgi:hypothetical protein
MANKGFPTGNIEDGSAFVNLVGVKAVADEQAVTLATTMKALWPDARTTIPAGALQNGRVFRVTAYGKATTDGTAGNYVWEVALGTGDAPAALATGATVAAVTGQTDVPWMAHAFAECRVAGTSGVIRLYGFVQAVTNPAGVYIIPSTNPVNITFNTTTAAALTVQLQRSGAGVYTATTTSVMLESLN